MLTPIRIGVSWGASFSSSENKGGLMAPQNVIAVIFDFDDTLTDESTTKLLEAHTIDPREFWGKRQANLLKAGWDPALAYLKLILDEVGPGKPFGKLTNARLREFGATLDFYQGIPDLFRDLRQIAREHKFSNPIVEFYIISSGLEEVILGTKCADQFEAIWGCTYYEEDGQIAGIKNSISFTEKTKYLFAINKGFKDVRVRPYVVNEAVEKPDRRVPFENMIYIGDGLTDVPCFSLLNSSGGSSFGVFDPKKKDSPKKAWEKLIVPKRVHTMNSPRYGDTDDLGALLRIAVREVCLRLELKSQTALGKG
jgi:phosphoserine phosphatase